MTLTHFLYILMGIPITLALIGASIAIGAVAGFPLMLARETAALPLRLLIIAVIALVRALPPILWVFLIFFGIGSGLVNLSPFTASVVAFGLIASVNMAEIYRGGLLSIPSGQWEAARVLNLSPTHMWRDVLLPQVLRATLPSSATYAIGLMKDSAIASTIGVTELAFRGSQISQLTFKGLQVFGVVGLCYILLSLPVAWLARVTERRLRRRMAR